MGKEQNSKNAETPSGFKPNIMLSILSDKTESEFIKMTNIKYKKIFGCNVIKYDEDLSKYYGMTFKDVYSKVTYNYQIV